MLSWEHAILETGRKRLYTKEAARISEHVLAEARVLDQRSQKTGLDKEEFLDLRTLFSERRGGS